MSYKVHLFDLSASPDGLTSELVRRFVDAIEHGVLAAGEQLPTTRELARDAGVNPMTAARVYRRLAELGYVTATVGRGTFVRSLPPYAADDLDDDWQAVALPAPPAVSRDRVVQESMRLAGGGDVISLGAAFAAPETAPTADLAAAAAAVLAEGGSALAYSDVEGVPALREHLGALGRQRGFASGADEILVTSGARQAIDLVARVVLRPGDVACVESPTFVGILGSLEATGARLIGIPTDDDGLDVDALERALVRHPVKLLVLQPSCQNPTGRHLSDERRLRLVELARERSFFVLEDGVYSDIVFSGGVPRALRNEAPAHFLYASSFSKTLGGGVRIGWIAARGPVFNRLVALKTQSDINTSALLQRVMARYLDGGTYPTLLHELGIFYRRRASVLGDALGRHLEGEVDATLPLGGHNVWVTFRRRLNEQALYAEAMRRGVTFTPAAAILPEASTRAGMRLSFSLADEEQLDEGVRRLAAALRGVLREERFSATAPIA